MSVNRAILFAFVAFAIPDTCWAQGKAALAREVAEYVLSKFGKEAAEVGVETLTRKIEILAIKYGDEAFVAVRKVGPRTFQYVEKAGPHGREAVKLMARFGDEAIWIVAKKDRMAIFVKFGDDAAESILKHGEIAEPLIEKYGKPAAQALKTLSSQNARRLAIMADDGDLAKIGRTSELLEVVAKHGDRAANFIWEKKSDLMTPAVLAAFLANPNRFLGTAEREKLPPKMP